MQEDDAVPDAQAEKAGPPMTHMRTAICKPEEAEESVPQMTHTRTATYVPPEAEEPVPHMTHTRTDTDVPAQGEEPVPPMTHTRTATYVPEEATLGTAPNSTSPPAIDASLSQDEGAALDTQPLPPPEFSPPSSRTAQDQVDSTSVAPASAMKSTLTLPSHEVGPPQVASSQDHVLALVADVSDVRVIRGPPMPPPDVAVTVEAPLCLEVPSSETAIAAVSLPLSSPGAIPRQEDEEEPASAIEVALNKISIPGLSLPMPDGMQKFDGRLKAFMLRLPYLYCESVARVPWAFLIVYAVIIAATISAAWHPVKINTDIEAFRRVDGEAAQRHASYEEALKHQKAITNMSSLGDRLTFEVELYYEAKQGNVFSEAVLRDVRSFEQRLRSLDGWVSMCAKSDPASRFRCDPGESLGNYAWPTRQGDLTPFTLAFNGVSTERMPAHAFLTYLHEGKSGSHDLRKFLPQQFGNPSGDSKLLRSIFSFTSPIGKSSAFTEDYKEFVSKELFPALKNATEQAEEKPDDPWVDPWSVRLYFRGHEIEAHEVRYYLAHDLKLSIGALVFAFLILWVHLRSLFLATMGLGQICLVPLLAWVMVPLEELSLAGFMCIFLVIGLASNDLFATKEFWRRVGKDSGHLPYPVVSQGPGYRDDLVAYYARRLERLFPALFFRFLPQFLITVSFLCFLASKIRPIREFGLYMSAGTAIACLVCVAVFPPLLILHEAHICPFVHRVLPRVPASILEPKSLPFPWRPLTRLLLRVSAPQFGKFIWIGVAIVSLILFIITCIVAAHSDNPGLPEVYSPSHHETAGRPLVDSFVPSAPAVTAAPSGTTICDLETGTGCGLHWCEAPLAATTATTTLTAPASVIQPCVCHRPQITHALGPKTCAFLNVSGRIAGQEFSSANEAARINAWLTWLQASLNVGAAKISYSGQSKLMTSLVLEHWESGRTDVDPVVQMPFSMVSLTPNNVNATVGNTCEYPTSCFCGSRICDLTSSTSTGETRIIDGNRLNIPVKTSRLLSASPAPSPTEVVILFGINMPNSDSFLTEKAEWSFDGTFEPVSPWAQRAMLSMCNNIHSDFQVTETQCWIQGFRAWLLAQGLMFPTQRFGNFQQQLKRFKREQSNAPITAMWTDVNDNMIATAFAFKISPQTNVKVKKILEDRDKWQSYVSDQNNGAATSASNAWATSRLWADAEAEHAAMSNAWLLMLLAFAITLIAGLLYTWDFAFTFLVVGVSLVAINFLAFFMFCMFQWAIGPWEVILMIVFLQYSVEPAFRVGRGAVWGDLLKKEMVLSANVVVPLPEKMVPPSGGDGGLLALPPADAPAAIMDEGQDTNVRAIFNPSDLLSDNSSDAALEDPNVVAARGEFETRLHQFTLSIANACFASALKIIFSGFFLLFCSFRLFTRLGAVAIIVEIIKIPCLFILLPSAILLCPTRERPDAVVLFEKIKEWMNARDS